MEWKQRDGMDLVVPFWNFIVGELTGAIVETLDIPYGQDDCLFISLDIFKPFSLLYYLFISIKF